MDPIIDRDFAEYLLRTFDDPQQHGVHQLFNEWWRFAPEEVKAKYVSDFETEPAHRAFVAERYYAEPLDLTALKRLLVMSGVARSIARATRCLESPKQRPTNSAK